MNNVFYMPPQRSEGRSYLSREFLGVCISKTKKTATAATTTSRIPGPAAPAEHYPSSEPHKDCCQNNAVSTSRIRQYNPSVTPLVRQL